MTSEIRYEYVREGQERREGRGERGEGRGERGEGRGERGEERGERREERGERREERGERREERGERGEGRGERGEGRGEREGKGQWEGEEEGEGERGGGDLRRGGGLLTKWLLMKRGTNVDNIGGGVCVHNKFTDDMSSRSTSYTALQNKRGKVSNEKVGGEQETYIKQQNE